MCGIVGLWNVQTERPLENVGLMLDAMQHRGPDGRGTLEYAGAPPEWYGWPWSIFRIEDSSQCGRPIAGWPSCSMAKSTISATSAIVWKRRDIAFAPERTPR